MVMAEAKVLAVKSNRAVVEIDGKKKTVNVRPDVSVRTGDIVIVAFNNIIGKK
jgi:hydrogenase maturation factor